MIETSDVQIHEFGTGGAHDWLAQLLFGGPSTWQPWKLKEVAPHQRWSPWLDWTVSCRAIGSSSCLVRSHFSVVSSLETPKIHAEDDAEYRNHLRSSMEFKTQNSFLYICDYENKEDKIPWPTVNSILPSRWESSRRRFEKEINICIIMGAESEFFI